MRKNSTNYTDSVICRKCYHPKQKKMYKNPALFHLTEPLSKDTPARCSGILKHIHGSINFHFFFLQVQPVYVKFFSLNRQPSEFCVKDNLICIKIYNIRYTGNKDYWKPEDVKIDNLIFAITTDPSVRIQKLKKNECQITLFPRPADLKALGDDKDLKLPHQAGFNLGYIAYNVMPVLKGQTAANPLADLRVREALDMSVNKQQIIDSVYQGAGQLAVNAMPPTQWSYDTTIKDAKYDPEKAKALLKEAGVKEGTEIVLWAMPVQRPYNPNAKLMAEMLQSDWKQIGLKVNIVSYEWGEYIKRSKGGENQAMIIGWSGDNGDPDNWLNVLFGCDSLSGNNFSKWCDKKFDGIVKEAKATSDVAKRTELYKQAQHILKDAVPMTPIAHSTVYQPMRNTVQDFKISPFGLNSFYGVSVSGK